MAELAGHQHGVVSHWQLIALGLGEDAIAYRIASGQLHCIHVGVYALGHRAMTRHGRWMAAALALGPAALLSHRSAASLWQILRYTGALIHVIAPRTARYDARPGIAVHRPRRIHPDDHAICAGIPVTSVSKTLIDIAPLVSLELLRHAWDEAERQRLFDLGQIKAVRARSDGRRGLRNIDLLIAERRPLPQITRSRLEQMFLEFCARYGLPIPSMNVWIGEFEVDAVFPDHHVAVELDGRDYHSHPTAQERDPVRDLKLQILGYKPTRITYRRLATEPDNLATDLRDLLAA